MISEAQGPEWNCWLDICRASLVPASAMPYREHRLSGTQLINIQA